MNEKHAVKKLRYLNDNPQILDVFDIEEFYQFFKDLYEKKVDSLDLAKKDYKQSEEIQNNLNKILDDEIFFIEYFKIILINEYFTIIFYQYNLWAAKTCMSAQQAVQQVMVLCNHL